MSFTVEQKSQLAKLMATENLRVEHQKINTAKFDTKNRILYLPIWQNMTGTLYDLLCGHEVGHALYTPPEGWHDVVADKTKGRNYKSFLNVVEDARIEKKVKRRYPGLKSSFQVAYSELMKRDFFGTGSRNINDMPFIDRLNLFSKSQWSATWIKFNKEETFLVDKVQNTETWNDVLRVTEEIYAYSKNEQFETAQTMNDFEFVDGDGDGDEYEIENGDADSDTEESDGGQETDSPADGKSKESDKADKKDEENEQKNKSDNAKKSDSDKSDDEEKNSKVNRFKDSNPADSDMFEPECQTDDSYRQNENSLLDEKCKPYIYINLPTPILKNIITPAKRVQEQLTKYYSKYIPTYGSYNDDGDPVSISKVEGWVNDFKRKNERYVGLLAKEFEMRKAAKAFSKSRICDTGDIDIGKLSGYKFDDNIFRKVMLTPKGKNHGLLLLLDKSGSMSKNMAGSIEQILVLAMFCRKVNIPFVVYGFGDSTEAHVEDLNIKHDEQLRLQYGAKNYSCFEERADDAAFGDVRMREYINSSMSSSEFSQCLRNMIILKKSYERNGSMRIGRPRSEHLSNTPLTQAIYVAGFLMKDFRRKFNLDLSSLILIHDGDSDFTSARYVPRERIDREGNKVASFGTERVHADYANITVRDRLNKFEMVLTKTPMVYDPMNIAIMEWFKRTTGSKIFGFFLMPPDRYAKQTISARYVFENGQSIGEKQREILDKTGRWAGQDIDIELYKKFKSEKFLVSHPLGYSSFFYVLGGEDLQTEEEEIEIEGKVTSNKLKTAFMKFNKKKALNRILVSKFIQGIAV